MAVSSNLQSDRSRQC